MEHIGMDMLLFMIIGGFVAAFIDSVVGGGGLITVPILMLTGLPPVFVLGTNKLGGTTASLTSTLSFLRSGKINFSIVKYLIPLAFIGAVCGTTAVKFIPSGFLRPLVVAMLIVVTIYTLFKRNWGKQSTYTKLNRKTAWISAAAAFGLGFYDGFFGPGTGSFLIFVFLLLGFDFVVAAGNAKILNLASNIASLATFIIFGLVRFSYGIPMAIAMIFGSLLGSQLAIRKGTMYVRPLFISITTMLVGKQLWDMLHH